MKTRRGQPHERNGDRAMWAVTAGCVLLALAIGALEILTVMRIVQGGPAIGDIVAFRPTGMGVDEEPITVAYASVPNGGTATCVLSPRVMRATGGSLVVEQRSDPARVYRVHWAGTRTADGAGDCGGQADLTIPVSDLRALASATGQLAPDGRIAARF